MSRKKAIIDQSKLDVIYLIINILFAIILVPYYLNFISIELYGFWLATSGVVILLEVFDLGINTLFIDKISRYYSNKDEALRDAKIITEYNSIGFSVVRAKKLHPDYSVE